MKKNIFCKIFGHKWLLKKYSSHLDIEGESLSYIKSRICTRCHQREVTFDNKLWVK